MDVPRSRGSQVDEPVFVSLVEYPIPDHYVGLREMFEGLSRRILEEGLAGPAGFAGPVDVSAEDLALAHDLPYLSDILSLRPTRRTLFAGFALREPARDISRRNVGATVQAFELALRNGISMQVCGGTVFAFRDHAAGLSVFNDVAVALLKARAEGRIGRAVVLSSDAYHPEGTVSILSRYPDFHTFSVFDRENWSEDTPAGERDIMVTNHTDDEEYLDIIESLIPQVYDLLQPHVVAYLSSAMVQNELPGGGFRVTRQALTKRDELVIGAAWERGVPIVVLTAGGRVLKPEEYIEVHLNTARVVRRYADKGWRPRGDLGRSRTHPGHEAP